MRKSRKRSQSSSSPTEVLRTRKTILPLPQFRLTLPSIKMPGQFLRNLYRVGNFLILKRTKIIFCFFLQFSKSWKAKQMTRNIVAWLTMPSTMRKEIQPKETLHLPMWEKALCELQPTSGQQWDGITSQIFVKITRKRVSVVLEVFKI